MWRIFIVLLLVGCSRAVSRLPGDEFLGVPYMVSPLGEAVLPDADPLIRFDVFDCTTFVETVLADANQEKLNKIRYKNGEVGFLSRNHFIESDWLQNNSELVENVSGKYAQTKIMNVTIDKKSWFKKLHNIDVDFVPIGVALEYIPYEYAHDIIVDKNMIVLFVADNQKNRDKIGTDLAIVHMGFVFPEDILRHASSEHGAVVDASFRAYMAARKQNKNNLGIVLVDIK